MLILSRKYNKKITYIDECGINQKFKDDYKWILNKTDFI